VGRAHGVPHSDAASLRGRNRLRLPRPRRLPVGQHPDPPGRETAEGPVPARDCRPHRHDEVGLGRLGTPRQRNRPQQRGGNSVREPGDSDHRPRLRSPGAPVPESRRLGPPAVAQRIVRHAGDDESGPGLAPPRERGRSGRAIWLLLVDERRHAEWGTPLALRASEYLRCSRRISELLLRRAGVGYGDRAPGEFGAGVPDQVWDAFLAGLGDAIGAGLAATTAS
jgi:hypothetical protein